MVDIAWSEAFEPETLRSVPPIEFPNPITKDWAWGEGTGKRVKVGVLDSGIDASHPWVGEIQGGVALEYDPDEEVGLREVDGPHEDLYGHGTACAAIIRKLAPECDLYSIRVLGERLTGKGFIFAHGLRWAIRTGLDVVNLSLSTGKRDYYEIFHEIADEAYFNNVMLVCAMNNNPGPTYPSEYASVFSVASHEDPDPYSFDYNPDPPVEFGAPGIGLELAWKDGATLVASGNSFAAPHMAGLITKILSKHPGLTPFQMKTILQSVASNTAR